MRADVRKGHANASCRRDTSVTGEWPLSPTAVMRLSPPNVLLTEPLVDPLSQKANAGESADIRDFPSRKGPSVPCSSFSTVTSAFLRLHYLPGTRCSGNNHLEDLQGPCSSQKKHRPCSLATLMVKRKQNQTLRGDV